MPAALSGGGLGGGGGDSMLNIMIRMSRTPIDLCPGFCCVVTNVNEAGGALRLS